MAAVISFFKVSYDPFVLVVDVSTFKIRTFYFQLTWIRMPDPNTRDGRDWYRKRLFLLGPSVTGLILCTGTRHYCTVDNYDG